VSHWRWLISAPLPPAWPVPIHQSRLIYAPTPRLLHAAMSDLFAVYYRIY